MSRDSNGAPTHIVFDVRWPQSFRDTLNWDAAWIFAKVQVTGGDWRHATLSSEAGDHIVGATNGVTAEIVPAEDGRGVFLQRAGPGVGPTNWDDVRLRWDYAADGISTDASVRVRVFALEMVYVPEGPFYTGDGDIGNVAGHFQTGNRGAPYFVESENAITLGGPDSVALGNNGGYGMQEGGVDDFNDSIPSYLPRAFPKGFRGFYVMKYELTQGEYARFLNMLNAEQQARRNPAQAQDGRTQPGRDRYTISTVYPFFAFVPDRAANSLSWADGAAFADWAALRPMTELEYEKASRGPAFPEPGEYPWGTTRIADRRYVIDWDNTPDERIENPGLGRGNAAYNVTLGAGPCPSCIDGPLSTGSFAFGGATREESGATFYGAMDMGGNVAERIVTIGNSAGRRFDGHHGDGHLSSWGNAGGVDVGKWPGSTATGEFSQVTGALGTGFRGGSWASPAAELHTSTRTLATTTDNRRDPRYGYRFVRTSPEPGGVN